LYGEAYTAATSKAPIAASDIVLSGISDASVENSVQYFTNQCVSGETLCMGYRFELLLLLEVEAAA
jgi:hypothetical protein